MGTSVAVPGVDERVEACFGKYGVPVGVDGEDGVLTWGEVEDGPELSCFGG